MKGLLQKFNLRFNRDEISGSLGDMGTFLPLVVGVVNRSGMNFGHILFFAGAMHFISGLMFGIPMPVQPMKSIAAIAIAEGLDSDTIIAAGIGSGVVLVILALTGLIDRINRFLPKSLVRGIQLAIGLKLLIKGVSMVQGTGFRLGPDSIYIALICFAVIFLASSYKRFPGAIVIFSFGLVLVFIASPQVFGQLTFGWEFPTLHIPSPETMLNGFWRGTIPQIPLTLLNSVIAVCALSTDLFPDRSLSPRKVTLSVAAMNLIACPLGGMPMCHGAGGLAAQYRFGARTGGSVVFLGLAKMILAVLFGSSLLAVISLYPASVLGVLLAFSGLELAVVCRDQTQRSDFFIMILTAGVCIVVNVAVGFVFGLIVALILRNRNQAIPKPSFIVPTPTNVSPKEVVHEK